MEQKPAQLQSIKHVGRPQTILILPAEFSCICTLIRQGELRILRVVVHPS